GRGGRLFARPAGGALPRRGARGALRSGQAVSALLPGLTLLPGPGGLGYARSSHPANRRTVRMRSLPRYLSAVGVGAMLAVPAAAQLPKSLTIGANPPGTGYYAVASGLAKVVTQATGVQMVVQPHSGTSTMLPLLNTGEMEFGTVNAVDMGLAYRGPSYKIGGRNPFQFSPNVRLVQRGSPLLVGLLVRKDSPIKNVTDVKGKRMTGEYPAHLAVWYNMFGHLASAGYTWSDVKVIPVPAVNDGVDALVAGRADVTEHALGAARTKEG